MAAPALSIQQFNRRVAIRAAASFAAMAAATRAGVGTSARAQSAEEPVTSSLTWVEAEHPGYPPRRRRSPHLPARSALLGDRPDLERRGGRRYPDRVLGQHRRRDWSDPVTVGEASHDAGPPDRDGRRFGELQLTEGASSSATARSTRAARSSPCPVSPLPASTAPPVPPGPTRSAAIRTRPPGSGNRPSSPARPGAPTSPTASTRTASSGGRSNTRRCST